jgi:hypothetical protein
MNSNIRASMSCFETEESLGSERGFAQPAKGNESWRGSMGRTPISVEALWRRCQARKHTSGGVFIFCDLDDAHTTCAFRTNGDIDGEDAFEEPRPWMSRGLGRRSKISFFTRPEEWQLRAFLDGLLGHDFGADLALAAKTP